jgi:hypothetical protein
VLKAIEEVEMDFGSQLKECLEAFKADQNKKPVEQKMEEQ